ncbi:MAG: hypothetical protein ABI693_18530 [Bryobacteraceae bacterium]
MLDFWEGLGRFIANEGGLRDILLEDDSLTSANTPVYCDPKVGVRHRESWSINTDKYYTLSAILAQHLVFQPASLVCMGEWLRFLPPAKSEGFTIPTTPVNLLGRDHTFYAALGAITVDEAFAAEFALDPGVFPLVTDPVSIADLVNIANDSNYFNMALNLCAAGWPPPCLVLVRPYSAQPTQTQPSLEPVP